MGYSIDLRGEIEVTPELSTDHIAQLMSFYYRTNKEDVEGAPGRYCCWLPIADGTKIIPDESEGHRDYAEWLEYLIEKFIKPWGYSLDGEVSYMGSDASGEDRGILYVKDNRVEDVDDIITNPGPSWGLPDEVPAQCIPSLPEPPTQ